jgi:hypothetical protein
LGADGLDVVIILGKKAPKVFEDLHPFKDLPINAELLTQRQSQCHCCFPLLHLFGPYLALFLEPVAGVKGVDLHPTPFTLIILTLLGDDHQIKMVHVPEMLPHHPTVL